MKHRLASLLLVAACGGDPGHDVPDATVEPDAEIDYPPASGVDVLFVIDDSASMDEEQDALASAFLDQFIGELEAAHGGRPDLHIGVISTDIGAGGIDIGNCTGVGDDGMLLTGRAGGACGLDRPYIVDVSDGAGGRTTNYPTTLGDAFRCTSDLDAFGCGFEQPLASLERAFTQPLNDGFFRDGAALAVVFLGDEDDCSAFDPVLFAPGAELGPQTSFRCFEFGVVCDPDEPRVEGARQDCVPRTDSPYMIDPVAAAAALKARKPPGHVAVAVIAGDPAPVVVSRDEVMPENPMLAASCESATGLAYPGIRLAAFAAELGARHTRGSICDSYADPLGDLATVIAAMLE